MATHSKNAVPGTPIVSLWSATASVPHVSYPRLDVDLRADVAIVGGGYMGLSSALHLAEAGRSVVVLEAEDIGFGASGRNGGQANPGLRVTEAQLVERFGERGRGLFRLGEEATDFLADLVHRKSLRCSFVRPGVIRLAHSDKALAGLEAFHKGATARGIATRMLSKGETSKMVGDVRYIGGLFDPRGGSVHPLDLAREMARVSVDGGARIFTRSQVTALDPGGGGWVVRTRHGTVTARQVIVATNGYSDRTRPGPCAIAAAGEQFPDRDRAARCRRGTSHPARRACGLRQPPARPLFPQESRRTSHSWWTRFFLLGSRRGF